MTDLCHHCHQPIPRERCYGLVCENCWAMSQPFARNRLSQVEKHQVAARQLEAWLSGRSGAGRRKD